MPYNIAVTAVGGGVGASILRSLRLSSLELRIIGLDVNPWSAGLYTCDQGYTITHSLNDNFIIQLLDIMKSENINVLIPGSDDELSAISHAREQFISNGITPIVGSKESVDLCRNKLASYNFFTENNAPFARTTTAENALHLADEIGFPLIIKPVGGMGSRGITIALNKKQLIQQIDQPNIIVQEYLAPSCWGKKRGELTKEDLYHDGLMRQTDEISIQILFDYQGNLLGTFTSYNELRWGSGTAIFLEPYEAPEAEKIALRMALLLKDKGLVGPCNFQCRITTEGPMFFELNPRFNGVTAARSAMGFNEVDASLRRILLNEPITKVQESLSVQNDVMCSRYVAEIIFSRKKYIQLQTKGNVSGGALNKTIL